MTKKDPIPNIIALFNDLNRQKEYESIYDDERRATISSQLSARILLLKVFRNRYLNEDAIQFTFEQEYRLFKELTESAYSTVSRTTLGNLYTEFTHHFTQNRNKLTTPTKNTYGINEAEYAGSLISFPTANELINLVDVIREKDDEGNCSIPFSDAIAETPRQLQDSFFLLKVNLSAHREDLLKEFDTFVKNKQTSFPKRGTDSQISRAKLKATCYLEFFDMMIFEAFYEKKQNRVSNKEMLDIKKLHDCDNFYGTSFSFNSIIKETVDIRPIKELLESYRKTVKKNINNWVDDELTFIRQMSELKIN
jgi:hypothetical protein